VTTTGGGTITSNPAGINCGSACAASFTVGSAVTLSAAPFAGMAFQGWSGACTGTAACTLTMNAAKAVTATFAAAATDVSIAQAILPAQPVVGGDALVTLTAANAGPLRATAVTVTYTVPTGWQLIWMTPACGAAASHVICTVMALSPGASQEFDVVMRPASSGNASSVVTVAATESDPALADNTSTLTLSAADAPVAKAVERYRLYSPVTLEHHFTTDANEYAVLGQYGWVQEGTAGKVLDNPGSFNGVEAVPYYRLYNSITRWHHWTTDANEYYTLRGYPGWNAEGIDGYILPNAAAGSTQLFRLVYPNGTGLHHWTIDPDEYAALIATYGWVGEGGAGFVIE